MTHRQSLTTAQLARRSGSGRRLLEQVLREEAERGHVEPVGRDGWAATPLLVARFGRAFRDAYHEGGGEG